MNRRSFFKTLFGGAIASTLKLDELSRKSDDLSFETHEFTTPIAKMLFEQASRQLNAYECEELARAIGILE